MKYYIIIAFIVLAGSANAQHITQVTPPNITFRGICLGDYSHSMVVGDSASIFISRSKDSIRYWYPLAAPCDKSHTFNGVSYYDTTHAAIISDGGMIFISTDAGEHWQQSGAGMTGQTLRAITHTGNGGLIVVGDSGVMLRSTDSGATWSKIVLGTTYNINAIDISTDGRGFFAGAHGLIGRTTNFGATWPLITDTTTNFGANRLPITFRGVAIGSGWEGVAVGDSGGFVKTTNGTTWIAIQDSDYGKQHYWDTMSYTCALYLGWSGWTWLVGTDRDIYVNITAPTTWFSTNSFFGDADGGADQAAVRWKCAGIWRNQPEQVLQFCSIDENVQTVGSDGFWWNNFVEPDVTIPETNFLFASFDSSGNGYATGTGAVFMRSNDNGLTWNEVLANINYEATDIHAIDSDNAFAVGWAGSIFRTTNGGVTWDSTGIAAANQERLHSIAHPANNAFVACGDFGTMIRSTDNASTWVASVTPTTNYLEAVAFSGPQIGVAVGTNGTIIRTTDQGVTWTNINNQLSGTDYSYRRLQAFPSGTYYAGTDSAGLWRSTDNGLNWSNILSASQTMGMEFYNEQIGVIAEQGWPIFDDDPAVNQINDTARLAFTTDGFTTPSIEFNIPIVNNGRMAFHFLDSNTFLCFGSDGFVVKVDMSQGGASVTNLPSQQPLPVELFPDPNSTHSATIEYDLDKSCPITIELWNTLGEKVQTLFMGSEEAGHHSQQLRIGSELHGSFFVKLFSGEDMRIVPVAIE